ncbi:MAG: inositol monophosphatase [Bacteroidetes bacterium HGW-Bacteroidetes-1]|jgi:myo-inositol-1(or 4)-monophosphatase|nr:MAG: inositol monophosphatase [Bacteroidetes bacterium HGW-Bacteroidetes-1]
MNLEKITLEVTTLCRLVGTFIKEQSEKVQSSDIKVKGLHDLVSYVDKEAERRLIERLRELLPSSGFIAEESGTYTSKNLNWIIDPLDGTTNFLHKIPIFSISIALQENNETILGVVYEINLDECFYAWKGSPAYLNGKIIHVSTTDHLQQSLIATGFPYNDFSRMNPYLLLFDDLLRNTRGVRRLGSAAADLAYVACGRFDTFYEYSLHPWDVAGGAFIVQQAGGIVSRFNGDDDFVFGKEIVASNAVLHDKMLEKIRIYFG